MPNVICARCGKEFKTKTRNYRTAQRHFCSRACYDGIGRAQITCSQCQCVYDASLSKSKAYLTHFCSAECQTLYRQSHNARLQRQCEHCGITFETRGKPTANLPYKFCSRECQNRALDSRFDKECPVCHKIFLARPCQTKRGFDTYCSRPCKIKGKERTSLEKATAHILDKLQVEYIEQHPIGRYMCDFYLPKCHLVIEADGFYHHKLPKVQVSDERKNAYLLAHGHKVLRLQSDDRNRLPPSAEQQILEFVEMRGTHVQLALID